MRQTAPGMTCAAARNQRGRTEDRGERRGVPQRYAVANHQHVLERGRHRERRPGLANALALHLRCGTGADGSMLTESGKSSKESCANVYSVGGKRLWQAATEAERLAVVDAFTTNTTVRRSAGPGGLAGGGCPQPQSLRDRCRAYYLILIASLS